MKKVILTSDSSHVEIIGGNAVALNDSLRTKLTEGIAHFAFQKKDGSIREAFGTVQAERIAIPSGEGPKTNQETTGVYFDLGSNAWRSYTIANLIAVY